MFKSDKQPIASTEEEWLGSYTVLLPAENNKEQEQAGGSRRWNAVKQ
jgi:hypothetical protein